MKNIISEISQKEKNRILEMHKKATSNQYLMEEKEAQPFKLEPGLIGVVEVGTYEGRTYVVNKITPLNCGITEVEFKSGQRLTYGYFKATEDVNEERRAIDFQRFGEGVKATNACEDYDSDEFEDLGSLQFGTKPGEKPNIYQ
jgi:hypothetical protein